VPFYIYYTNYYLKEIEGEDDKIELYQELYCNEVLEHTKKIGTLSIEALVKIRDTINVYLKVV